MQEEEQELTSVVELEELRKSLGDDHSFLLPSTPHDLDASWVIHEEMDASTGFTDGGAKKNCPDNTARISPALSAQLSGCHRSIAQCSRRALIRRRVTTRGDAEVGIHLFGVHSRGLVQNRHLAVASAFSLVCCVSFADVCVRNETVYQRCERLVVTLRRCNRLRRF